MTANAGPVSNAERLYSIDALRGFALLGILLMNIVTFAYPEAGYMNPAYGGGDTPVNKWAIVLQYIFAEGKMRGIFSMMFGASAVLLITRGETKGAGLDIADVYYRRTLWLGLFGILHAFLVWWGDILYPYALVGLMLFPFRKMSPKWLLILATVQIVLLTGAGIGQGFDLRERQKKGEAAMALEKEGKKLSEEQKKELDAWKDTLKSIKPSAEEVKKELDAYRGTYVSAVKQRAKQVMRFHSMPYWSPFNWDMMSMMFVGIAFLKMGVLTAERSFRFYGWLAAVSLVFGVAINSVTAWFMLQQNFDPVLGAFNFAGYEIGRVPVSIAYMALLMIVVKAGALKWLTSRLSAVGQMAFSNYITHSVVCGFLFYGYGLGLMGQLQRYQLYFIVLAIWTVQLIVSPIWLRHFQFGPLEWGWRSLTYWKRQPMRHHQGEPAVSLAGTPVDSDEHLETVAAAPPEGKEG